jgi:hypothetical protein
MSNKSIIPEGVVLDDPIAKTFLFVAISEGLMDKSYPLDVDEHDFISKILTDTPTDESISIAYEQLIISGKIFLPFKIPFKWKGELIDKNILISNSQLEEYQPSINIQQLPSEIILGMLSSRNINWSFMELQERYQSFIFAYNNWNEDINKIPLEFKSDIEIALSSFLELENKYTTEQLSKYKALKNELEKIQPIINCIDSYERVINKANLVSALSYVSVNETSYESLIQLPYDVSHSMEEYKYKLYRITCNELRRIPYGRTLKETIQLATSSEAIALRKKLNEWCDKIAKGELKSIDTILKEIENARKSLKYSKTISKVGNIVTWLSIPVSIVPIIGPILSITSAGLSSCSTNIEKNNNWVMFS